jgi:hypothetical protein
MFIKIYNYNLKQFIAIYRFITLKLNYINGKKHPTPSFK